MPCGDSNGDQDEVEDMWTIHDIYEEVCEVELRQGAAELQQQSISLGVVRVVMGDIERVSMIEIGVLTTAAG